MEARHLIGGFVLIPFIGFFLSLFIPGKNERAVSLAAYLTVGTQLLAAASFVLWWLSQGAPALNIEAATLYRTREYAFTLDFLFDGVSAVYLMVGAFISALILRFSRYYLHLADGYKRYFNTILLFYLGYNLTALAGNFETLFVGWEILGLSSFLLVAFYRERYLPTRNAVKVFSIYRIGDVGILLAMWASHHLWHENVTFVKLNHYDLVHEHLQAHSGVGLFISMMILLAAAAKSAQLPFSSWLPRAMEGPTPSSAIFYGSLSVHFGVFLLLRTYPFWEHQTAARVVVGLVGLATALVAFPIARVQSTIKAQIAYASIAQIGIMFIEIALGLKTLALIHFAGNAFLRTYQLLVSPSAVSYLIRDQFYHFKPREHTLEDSFPRRLEYAFFILSIKEWHLDYLINRLVFRPFKKIGHRLDFLSPVNVAFFFVPLYLAGWWLFSRQDYIPALARDHLPELFAFLGLLMVFKSFSERHYPRLSWLLVIMNHFWMALAVSFNEEFHFSQTLLYLSGVVLAGVIGFACLQRLRRLERERFGLNQYYGHVYEHPRLALVFLISGLGVMGFPITGTFIGEDLIFSHINERQFALAFFNALSFVLGGIAIIRIYARLFLGPHVKTYHETPLKSF